MTGGTSGTALVVVADAAGAMLAPWRRRFHAWSVERRIPAHLTILFPFVPADRLDDELEATLQALYAPFLPFAYDLARVASFPGVAWLAPEPSAPFLDLIAATRTAFPDYPPYGDPALEPVPHCTVGGDAGADVDDRRLEEMLAELREGLGPALPIRCRAEAVTLLVEQADGTWRRGPAFPLEGRAA